MMPAGMHDIGEGGTPYVAGASHTYEYNALGQLTGIKETSPNVNLYHVGNMQYGAAGQLMNVTYAGGSTQARVYNERLQMTKQTFSTGLEFQYIYPATGNNGQIQDFTIKSGATTVQTARYNYDSLARLSSASTIAGTISWSQTYNYDGFGNLNSVVGTNGWNIPANAGTNQVQGPGFSYDSNGNMLTNGLPQMTTYQYDIENRLVKTTTPSAVEEYRYGIGNQRVWRKLGNGSSEYYFYRSNGERTGKYFISPIVGSPGQVGFFSTVAMQESVVPKALQSNRDRLGNNYLGLPGTVYLPYGDEYTSSGAPPANDRDKFATYHRDGATGLDYAVNRYFTKQTGRFLTADPYKASGGPGDPASWNRYSFGQGDPANSNDPSGLATVVLATRWYSQTGRLIAQFGDDQFVDTSGETVPLYPDPPGSRCIDIRTDGDPALTFYQGAHHCVAEPLLASRSYPGTQVDAVRNGFATAWFALNGARGSAGTCLDFFARSEPSVDNYQHAEKLTWALAWLARTEYRILPLGNPGTALATINGTSVFINSGGAFFAAPDANREHHIWFACFRRKYYA